MLMCPEKDVAAFMRPPYSLPLEDFRLQTKIFYPLAGKLQTTTLLCQSKCFIVAVHHEGETLDNASVTTLMPSH